MPDIAKAKAMRRQSLLRYRSGGRGDQFRALYL